LATPALYAVPASNRFRIGAAGGVELVGDAGREAMPAAVVHRLQF